MRVTNRMLLEMVQNNISRASERMGAIHSQLSTGKRVNVPSDDPPAAATALALRASMAENEQYLRNIESAQTWLNATEVCLQDLEDTLVQAKTLAVRAANGTWDQEQLQSMARQAEALLQQAIQIGNSTLRGDYLFSGFKIDTEPFTFNGTGVDYQGDEGSMERTIGRGIHMTVNITGSSVFPSVFEALTALTNSLSLGQNTALPLTELDECIDNISSAHGEIGAKIKRLDNTSQRYSAMQVNLASVLSRAVDLDFAEGVSELTAQETIYKAALAAAARINQTSLLDYLE